MKIERDDLPYIAKGRVAKSTSKRSNQIIVVSVVLVVAAVMFANKLPQMLAYAMMIGGGALLYWDIWVVVKKRKYVAKQLLAEWNKDNTIV